jgi:hypothetical protein
MKKIFILIFLLFTINLVYSQVPNPPVLQIPADYATNVVLFPTFQWQASSGATSYRLQIWKSSQTVFDQLGITGTSYVLTQAVLEGNTLYTWRMNATNSSGTSTWSGYFHFTTGLVTPDPPIVHTVNRGNPVYADSSTIFEWHKVPTATSYRIQIATGSGFPNPIINEVVYDTLYIAPPNTFIGSTQYFWRVNASNAGGASPWSSIWSFTTMPAPPSPPSLLYPPNNYINVPLTPTLDWTDVPGATSYRVVITSVLDTVVAVSQYPVPSGKLNYYTDYYWRVTSINISGQGLFSPVSHFRTINQIGINQISSEIPAEYKLYNNYPNPFNPTTNIKYQITKNKFTTLRIYDILGREIFTLVNEIQNAGTYEVQFNSNELSGGIYFYTIRSGDFTDTKKMLLIK